MLKENVYMLQYTLMMVVGSNRAEMSDPGNVIGGILFDYRVSHQFLICTQEDSDGGNIGMTLERTDLEYAP